MQAAAGKRGIYGGLSVIVAWALIAPSLHRDAALLSPAEAITVFVGLVIGSLVSLAQLWLAGSVFIRRTMLGLLVALIVISFFRELGFFDSSTFRNCVELGSYGVVVGTLAVAFEQIGDWLKHQLKT